MLSSQLREALGSLTREAQDPTRAPILSRSELGREPLKWLKYIVMDRLGVESIERVRSQIRRFSLDDISSARDCARELVAEHAEDRGRLVVAKVVPWDRGAQLANFRMQTIADVDRSFASIIDTFAHQRHELWCCDSSIRTDGFNLGGRINFPGLGRAQVLELVWFASPRSIESVSLPGFHLPYLKAIRPAYARPEDFEFETVHIPPDSELDRHTQLADALEVANALDSRFSNMLTLVSTLRQIGAGEVCYCFKVSEGELTIIDWDSELESTAN